MSRESASSSTDLEALAAECEIEFTRGSGPGGQHRNKVETGVRLSHRPSGIVVQASERRSQARNRKLALERLAAKLSRRAEAEEQERRRRNRRPTRPTAGAKRRRLEAKKQRSRTKQQRRRVRPPSDD